MGWFDKALVKLGLKKAPPPVKKKRKYVKKPKPPVIVNPPAQPETAATRLSFPSIKE